MSSHGEGPYYPIGPFRGWLLEQLDRHERLFHMNQADFAEHIGVPERRLHRWLYENQTVSLGYVDSVVCRFGDPALLDEFCPIGSEVPRPRPAARKCVHGDVERDSQGRCRICRRETRAGARELVARERVAA